MCTWALRWIEILKKNNFRQKWAYNTQNGSSNKGRHDHSAVTGSKLPENFPNLCQNGANLPHTKCAKIGCILISFSSANNLIMWKNSTYHISFQHRLGQLSHYKYLIKMTNICDLSHWRKVIKAPKVFFSNLSKTLVSMRFV